MALIKLDIQGAELRALRGATETITKDAPNILFEAWDHKHLDAITHFLTPFGYEIIRVNRTNYYARIGREH